MKAHLDPDTLAAFAEHSIRGDEEAAVFAHLADCGICRQYLAVNAGLRDFRWNGSPARSVVILRAFAAAATIAALWLLFFLQPVRREVAHNLSGTPSIGNRFAAAASWSLSSTHGTMATKFPRALSQVTLTNVSFSRANRTGEVTKIEPALNQIALKTSLGERWITVERFRETTLP